jgi:hypothetical protein
MERNVRESKILNGLKAYFEVQKEETLTWSQKIRREYDLMIGETEPNPITVFSIDYLDAHTSKLK